MTFELTATRFDAFLRRFRELWTFICNYLNWHKHLLILRSVFPQDLSLDHIVAIFSPLDHIVAIFSPLDHIVAILIPLDHIVAILIPSDHIVAIFSPFDHIVAILSLLDHIVDIFSLFCISKFSFMLISHLNLNLPNQLLHWYFVTEKQWGLSMLATFGSIQSRPTCGNHVAVWNFNCAAVTCADIQLSVQREVRAASSTEMGQLAEEIPVCCPHWWREDSGWLGRRYCC